MILSMANAVANGPAERPSAAATATKPRPPPIFLAANAAADLVAIVAVDCRERPAEDGDGSERAEARADRASKEGGQHARGATSDGAQVGLVE